MLVRSRPKHVVPGLEVSARKQSFIHSVPLPPELTGPSGGHADHALEKVRERSGFCRRRTTSRENGIAREELFTFKGSMAHVAIWNALIPGECIASIWNAGLNELRATPMFHSYV
jgi:hypothetical protein